MKGYHMVDRRPCVLEESGDPFTIPTPPEGESHSTTHTHEPSSVPRWCIAGVIIGLLAMMVGLIEVFLG